MIQNLGIGIYICIIIIRLKIVSYFHPLIKVPYVMYLSLASKAWIKTNLIVSIINHKAAKAKAFV